MMQESTTGPGPEPVAAAELGVGMRFSLHPHCDDFVEVILGSLTDAADLVSAAGLTVESDEVSTYVGAAGATAEEDLVGYLAQVVTGAWRRSRGGHVVAQVLLSRGCPGEASCDLKLARLPRVRPVRVRPVRLPCVAQWSLYPLLDGHSDGGDHMAHIEAAIDAARERGVAAAPQHYATKLTGDLADVLATVADAWTGVGAGVPHVVSHLTLSVGSPSVQAEDVR
jgi:energy-coupling factor transport system substrate-specific component